MKLLKTNGFILMTVLSLMAIAWLVYPKVTMIPIPKMPNDSTAEFSATRAYEHVKHLAQKIGPRPAGSKSELAAAQYISYVLNQNGWRYTIIL